MNYRFYYPEWNSRKEVCKEYPPIKEITREQTKEQTKELIKSLIKIAKSELQLS